MAKKFNHHKVTRRDVVGADHTFSGAEARKAAEVLVLDWLLGQYVQRSVRPHTLLD